MASSCITGGCSCWLVAVLAAGWCVCILFATASASPATSYFGTGIGSWEEDSNLQRFYLRKYGYFKPSAREEPEAQLLFNQLFRPHLSERPLPAVADDIMRQPRCGLPDIDWSVPDAASAVQPLSYRVLKFNADSELQGQAEARIHAAMNRLGRAVPALPTEATDRRAADAAQLRFHLRQRPCRVGGASAVSDYRFNGFTRVHEVTLCLRGGEDVGLVEQIVLHSLGHVFGLSHARHPSGRQPPSLQWSPLYGAQFSNRPEDLATVLASLRRRRRRLIRRRAKPGDSGGSSDCEYLYALFLRNSRVDSVLLMAGSITIFSGKLKFWFTVENADIGRCDVEPWRTEINSLLPIALERIDAVCQLLPSDRILLFSGKFYWIFDAEDDQWTLENEFPAYGRPLEALGLPRELDAIRSVICEPTRVLVTSDDLYWALPSNLSAPADPLLYPKPLAWLNPLLSHGRGFYSVAWDAGFVLVGDRFLDLSTGKARHLLSEILAKLHPRP